LHNDVDEAAVSASKLRKIAVLEGKIFIENLKSFYFGEQ